MSVEKLTIEYEKSKPGSFTGKMQVLFNPGQLSFQSSATWERVDRSVTSKNTAGGLTQFKSLAPETLTLSLLFDTYAPYPSDAAGGILGAVAAAGASLVSSVTSLAGGTVVPPESVTKLTGQVIALSRLDKDLHRPPVCKLSWGKSTLFRGVLQRASRTYTLFWQDGTPVRATMECTFMEVPAEGSAATELYSADVVKKYIVRPGDSLMSIAASFYGDGSGWRRIAEENGIEDPRALSPGRTLSIPRVR